MNGQVNSQGGFNANLVGEITQIDKANDSSYVLCKGQDVSITNELLNMFGFSGVGSWNKADIDDSSSVSPPFESYKIQYLNGYYYYAGMYPNDNSLYLSYTNNLSTSYWSHNKYSSGFIPDGYCYSAPDGYLYVTGHTKIFGNFQCSIMRGTRFDNMKSVFYDAEYAERGSIVMFNRLYILYAKYGSSIFSYTTNNVQSGWVKRYEESFRYSPDNLCGHSAMAYNDISYVVANNVVIKTKDGITFTTSVFPESTNIIYSDKIKDTFVFYHDTESNLYYTTKDVITFVNRQTPETGFVGVAYNKIYLFKQKRGIWVSNDSYKFTEINILDNTVLDEFFNNSAFIQGINNYFLIFDSLSYQTLLSAPLSTTKLPYYNTPAYIRTKPKVDIRIGGGIAIS